MLHVVRQALHVGIEELAAGCYAFQCLVNIHLGKLYFTAHLVADSQCEGLLSFVHFGALGQNSRNILLLLLTRQKEDAFHLEADANVTVIIHMGLVTKALDSLQYHFFLCHSISLLFIRYRHHPRFPLSQFPPRRQ